MDKQQAAEKMFPMPEKGDLETVKSIQYYRSILKAGWEARELQSPTDAVAFLEWILKNDYYVSCNHMAYSLKNKSVGYTIPALYKLFNPSGTSPQTGDRFLQGYACAVANLLRLNGEADTRTCELFRDGIGKLSNLEGAGIDPSDMKLLKQHFK